MKTATFTDFDAFADTVTDVDCVMTLRNPKHRTWVVHQVQLPRAHVQLGRLGSGNIVEGQSWSDGYLLYLPLTKRCLYRANGEVIPADSFMILEPGSEFALSTADEHDWCTIFVPGDALALRQGNDSLSDSERGQCRLSEANPYLAAQFQSALSQLISAAIENPNFEPSPAAVVAEKELVKIASSVLQIPPVSRPEGCGRKKISRNEIIRRCNEHQEEFAEEPVSVSDLAAAAGVSERTLRTAFQVYYGMGPAKYLQMRQLNRIHHELNESSPDEQTVSDILLRHGIWEHGRFASRYRQLFGEKPSTTLRSTSR